MKLIAGIVIALCIGAFGLAAWRVAPDAMSAAGADHPHRWFAWHPVRLQGGDPIPTVQEGGRVVWLKTIERFRFFDHWVYREIGDDRELTR